MYHSDVIPNMNLQTIVRYVKEENTLIDYLVIYYLID